MENYWDGFCRKNNKYFGVVAMSVILESFYWYCQGDIDDSDETLKASYDREMAKPLDLDKKGLLPCPNCGCRDLSHHYVYIKCNKCLMCGPKGNGGHNDHVDYMGAIEDWNSLPRKNNDKNMSNITKDRICINDQWIVVSGLGRIGMYAPDKKAILLDYSMKWIVGSNDEIPCKEYEIKDKIIELFNKTKNDKYRFGHKINS